MSTGVESGDSQYRLGLIVPSTNSVAEADMNRETPAGVTVHSARMFIEETTVEGERDMLEIYFPDALRDVASVKPDVVVFSCTSASAVLGAEADQRMMEQIEDLTGVPAVSTNASIQKELADAGVSRALVVTAYVEELTERIARGVEDSGITVVKAIGMGIVDPFAICEVTPDEIYSTVRTEAEEIDIDGVFISCTNLRAMEVRQKLQDELGIPVITSNQAALAQAMKALAGVEAAN